MRTVNITVVWNVTWCTIVYIFRRSREITFHPEYGGSKLLRKSVNLNRIVCHNTVFLGELCGLN